MDYVPLLDALSEMTAESLDLAQSAGDAAVIIERLHPPGRGATAFSGSPWSVHSILPTNWTGMVLDDTDRDDEPTVHPSRWPGGIGEEPLMGEPV